MDLALFARGFALGFVSGLGAATADATYAAVASFGVSVLASVLIDQQLWLRLVGGTALVYLGLKALRTEPASSRACEPASHRSGCGWSTSGRAC